MQFDLFSAKVSINNAIGVKIPSKYKLTAVNTVLFPCSFGVANKLRNNYVFFRQFLVTNKRN